MKVGPKTEPCRTPLMTKAREEYNPLNVTQEGQNFKENTKLNLHFS